MEEHGLCEFCGQMRDLTSTCRTTVTRRNRDEVIDEVTFDITFKNRDNIPVKMCQRCFWNLMAQSMIELLKQLDHMEAMEATESTEANRGNGGNGGNG